ncbi:SixA phosphatase family protein [Thiohalorhabdus sp. Cl-TMA]|uniref:Histidine phosphatase family protein n=1 Tax=Thiohalorhabdus methylotrophus TaxID=3242694 RepID=A0ABV4TV44_9GAMM
MKSVILIRHGTAEDVAADGSDANRELTPEGVREVETVARGLHTQVSRVHLIASSPAKRAVQSAQTIARVFNDPAFIRTDVLAPGRRPQDQLGWLWQTPPNEIIVLVGHEPDLGHLLSLSVAGVDWTFFHFEKGGCCMLSVPDNAEPGTGRLNWALTTAQARALAGKP